MRKRSGFELTLNLNLNQNQNQNQNQNRNCFLFSDFIDIRNFDIVSLSFLIVFDPSDQNSSEVFDQINLKCLK
jgi:hypothetical protein